MSIDTNPKKKIIAVAMSGGVDSSVAALLLKNQGYSVFGIYMHNWESPSSDDPYCTAQQDLSDAKAVCDHLDIPLHTVNLVKEYWNHVFAPCLNEFRAGNTPNPDIICNREIKFKRLLDHITHMGADYLATGHYAQKRWNGEYWELLKAADDRKDQTYFLYTMTQYQLSKSLFPIGHLTKPQVREIAAKEGLINANKKDSYGICFIGQRPFKQFLMEYIKPEPGNIETQDGKVIGQHDGLPFYTIGQRRGLNISGVPIKDGQCWRVVDKNPTNQALVVSCEPIPATTSLQLDLQSPNNYFHKAWSPLPQGCFKTEVKCGVSRSALACARIKALDVMILDLGSSSTLPAITPGQHSVLYCGLLVVGGIFHTVLASSKKHLAPPLSCVQHDQ